MCIYSFKWYERCNGKAVVYNKMLLVIVFHKATIDSYGQSVIEKKASEAIYIAFCK